MTLENFFKKNNIGKCDLMKMDIEGSEYQVLYSTPKKVFDKIDRIFLEIHKIENEPKADLINYLKKQGYGIKFVARSFLHATKPNLK